VLTKTVLIIQARMGSSRLPGKVLMPLGDRCVLDYVVSRCRLVKGVSEVVVATSVRESDQAIVDWCASRGVACFRGPEEDVLARYLQCAVHYEADYVIRVTSDCPFIDYELGNVMMAEMAKSPADLTNLTGGITIGLPMELISVRALQYIDRHGKEPRHREHVTYYAYEYPEQFQAVKIPVPKELHAPQLRITLDTIEDYEMLKRVASHFAGNPTIPSRDVIRYLLAHEDVAAINAHVRQKPVIEERL